MDCGSGLLLLLTRTIRQIGTGEILVVHTEEPSVPPDLTDWSRLAGHEVVDSTADSPGGPWHVFVRRGAERNASEHVPGTRAVFSSGDATPVGERLWLYTNFHCNLACSYCCAASSPQAAPRLLPPALAVRAADEFVALDGREFVLTGGEPFLHPDLGVIVTELAARLAVTVLTNAMVFGTGARRQLLESLPRADVTLQVSLDSAAATLHDTHRGKGSHAKALAGIAQARKLGFTVKVAATMHPDEVDFAPALNAFLDSLDIDEQQRLIRPVAHQGAAQNGQNVTLDTLAPEPTMAVDGIWWHPVAVTDPRMQVTTSPLPLNAAFDIIRDTVATQDAATREGRRHVFRCA